VGEAAPRSIIVQLIRYVKKNKMSFQSSSRILRCCRVRDRSIRTEHASLVPRALTQLLLAAQRDEMWFEKKEMRFFFDLHLHLILKSNNAARMGSGGRSDAPEIDGL